MILNSSIMFFFMQMDQPSTYKRRLCWPLLLSMCMWLSGCQQIADRLPQLVNASSKATAIDAAPESLASPSELAIPSPVLDQEVLPVNEAALTEASTVRPLKADMPKLGHSTAMVEMQTIMPRMLQDCITCPGVVVLPAGHLTMGSAADEAGRDEDESPQMRVAVAAFAMSKTEVTRGQWLAFERESGHRAASGCLIRREDGYENQMHLGWRYPGFAQSDDHPVVCVSWNDAQAYGEWLSRKTGHTYRLPKESEWEYAARAGTPTPFPWPEGVSQLCAYANGADAALKRHQPRLSVLDCNDGYPYTASVGSFMPNPWGLYDMHGNVMEWVQDCWSPRLLSNPVKQAPLNCHSRVMRGGGWDLTAQYLRSAYRGKAAQANQGSATGFRLVREIRE